MKCYPCVLVGLAVVGFLGILGGYWVSLEDIERLEQQAEADLQTMEEGNTLLSLTATALAECDPNFKYEKQQ